MPGIFDAINQHIAKPGNGLVWFIGAIVQPVSKIAGNVSRTVVWQ